MTGTSVGIKPGTAIATLVKTGSPSEGNAIRYRDFDDARAEARRNHLLASVRNDTTYTTITPNRTLGIPFKPRSFTSDYLDWPLLPALFPTSFPGVQTSRDALVIDIDRASLEMRMKRYLNPAVHDDAFAQEVPSALESSARFDAAQTRSELTARGFRPWQIFRAAYRPFEDRWIYWEPTTKLLDEKRADYMEQYSADSPAMLLAQSNRRAFDPPVFTTALATRHVVERGANAFPMQITDQDLFAKHRRANLTLEGTEFLHSINGDETHLFFHALAIMHTPLYRAENAGALLSDWPRIPLPATAELISHSNTLGHRLAELLDPESDLQLTAEWNFAARLSIATEFPEGTQDRDRRNAARLALTARWGSLQGGAVMPRRGKAPERDWTETELARLTTLATAQGLTLDDALNLLGTRCVDVYLNDAAHWAAVPSNVWDYTLGGYQVLKKWLSYRELPLLGRPLHEDEARYFAQVVRRIAAILLMGPALDAS